RRRRRRERRGRPNRLARRRALRPRRTRRRGPRGFHPPRRAGTTTGRQPACAARIAGWTLDFVTLESVMAKGPRLLLVHGSVVNGEVTWTAQRPLAERFELVVPNRRGFPPGPDVERVDFED